MQQHRRMDLLKDYDCEINYHLGTANPFADALSQKPGLLMGDNTSGFHFQTDELLCLSGRVVVPDDSTLRDEILSQTHRIRFTVLQVSAKMYKDIRTRLSKFAHFLPYNREFTFDCKERLYIQEIMRLHEVPFSIVSDRDPRFTSWFGVAFSESWTLL
ncbi:uncharacterized protein [Henckelia pumila]|uniref:uncharacterized protein n=1 Tax=Henckelia pumila TaxID=405737 RepID=UPI003C6E2299